MVSEGKAGSGLVVPADFLVMLKTDTARMIFSLVEGSILTSVFGLAFLYGVDNGVRGSRVRLDRARYRPRRAGGGSGACPDLRPHTAVSASGSRPG